MYLRVHVSLYWQNGQTQRLSPLGFTSAQSAEALCRLPIIRLIVWREKIDDLEHSNFCSLLCFLHSVLHDSPYFNDRWFNQ